MPELPLRASTRGSDHTYVAAERSSHPKPSLDSRRVRLSPVPPSIWVLWALVAGAAPWVALAAMMVSPVLFP